MRLIDAPIGIFRFDGELVLKTEYYSKDKQSGKYIPDCYIIRTGEYFWGSAKTANELINLDIEPVDFAELLPTVTDTISRQAAIDICANVIDLWRGQLGEGALIAVRDKIKELPSAQPKSGRWILDRSGAYCCSECMEPCAGYVMMKPRDKFCKMCGAKMEGIEDG